MNFPLLIGIAGPSRSGKSTMANALYRHYTEMGLRTTVVHQDDFVFASEKIPLISDRTNWEHPSSMDFDRQISFIREKKKNMDIIIVEGLLIFYDEALNAMFNVRILCEIDKFNFLRRKRKDARWGSIDSDWYIEHIWDSYHKFGRQILAHPDPTIRENLIYSYNHKFENNLLELIARIEACN